MKFSPTEPNDLYTGYRFLSETGRYELGMWWTIYLGMRVGISRGNRDPYILDYCCGKDRGLSNLVLLMLMIILRDIEESTHPGIIQSQFPIQYIKPIQYDCSLAHLQSMAGLRVSPFRRCRVCHYCHYELTLDVCTQCESGLPKEIHHVH